MPLKKPQQIVPRSTYRRMWEKYNQHASDERFCAILYINGIEHKVPSFAEYFFKTYKLDQYLFPEAQIIQFGASSGDFLSKNNLMVILFSATIIFLLH